MSGATYTPLARIPVPKGDVLRGLKATDDGFEGFGEAYFTTIEHGAVKGWRRHREMVMNLIVPVGQVRFVVHDDPVAEPPAVTTAYELSEAPQGYGRLTVRPGCWLAFQGLGRGMNLILNIASILHDPAESDSRDIGAIAWDWAL